MPADARLLEATDLQADELLLTGESVPVRKTVAPGETADVRPGGDDSPNVWSGSLIVRGTGLARVLATGARTEIGRIGKSLGTVESAPTPLQIQTRRLVRIFAVLGIGSSVVLAVVYGLLHGEWVKGILAGITLAMATLPEEFPLVLTVFLVLGAWRMSQSKVLTRRSAAIEALGAVTVLCTDKTGTLTLNRMTVAALVAGGQRWELPPGVKPELPERFHRLVEFAILASRPDPFDPMERAFSDLGERFLGETEHIHRGLDAGAMVTRSSPPCSRCRKSGGRKPARRSWSLRKARPRRSPICATSPSIRWRTFAETWPLSPQRGCGCWPSRRPFVPAQTGRKVSTTSISVSWAWSAWPTRYVRRCRRPSQPAPKVASGSS